MSIDVYAAKIEGDSWEPIFDFRSHQSEILAPDPDARLERDEDPFVPNPDYVADSGLNWSNGNAYRVLSAIGIEGPGELPASLPIKDISKGIEEWRPTTFDGGDMRERLAALKRIVVKGSEHGATHICFA